MPTVTFTVTGRLKDYGDDPIEGQPVTAVGTPHLKVGDTTIFSNAPTPDEVAISADDGTFTLTLVSLPGLWYLITGGRALNPVRIAAYTPDPSDPTTGTVFAPDTTFDISEFVDESPTPGYQGILVGGVTDHGELEGLDDDDHPQYALADGTRGAFASAVQGAKADSAVQPEDIAGLATSTALGAEEDARVAADAALLTTIGNETTARTAADAALDSRVDALEGVIAPDLSIYATDADLAAEAAARSSADAALDGRVDALEAAPGPDLSGYATDAELAAHAADTTGVHGIADTAALVLTADSRLSDARTPTAHTHDDRYYTETEVDALIAAGGGGGTGLYRGPWSTLTVVGQIDLSSGIPATILTNTGYSRIATPALTGTPPAGTHVLATGVINGTTRDITFLVPSGATVVRMVAAHGDTFGATSNANSSINVLVNGASAAVLGGPTPAWTVLSAAAVAGDTITVRTVDVGVWNTSGWVGQIEFLTASDPYMVGHTVTYNNRLWRSVIDSNTSTPGADANWVEEVLTVDQADVVGLPAALTGKLDTSAAPELIRDTMGTALVAGTGITLTVDDPGDTVTIAAAGGGGGGGGVVLLDYGASVPGGTASGTLVFEKGGTPQVFDFTTGALPSGWAAHGSPSATFSGSGISVACPVTTGYHKDMAVAYECYLEFWLVSQVSVSNIMFGPHFTDALGKGGAATWYSAPNQILHHGLTDYNYNGVYVSGGPTPTMPSRIRLHKRGTEYSSQVSIDGGVSWTVIASPIVHTATITRIGFGSAISTANAVVSRMIYAPGPPPNLGGKAKGWWDGSALQSLT